MDSNHWSSILESVKPLLPTIDSNSSSPENDDIVTVFQRPAGLSLKVPEDTQEDLESFLFKDIELEEQMKVKADAFESSAVKINSHKFDSFIKPNEKSIKSDVYGPVLSFAGFEQLDFDNILRNIKENGLSLKQNAFKEPINTYAGGIKDRSQENIMEKLVVFCKSQTFRSVSVESSGRIRQSNKWNKSVESVAAELQCSSKERPSVYIDLRCHDRSIKPSQTSPRLSSNYKKTPPAEKPNLKVHTRSQTGDREVTGKNLLLRQIREMNENGKKYNGKFINPAEEKKIEELKNKPPQHVESTLSCDSQNLQGDEEVLPVKSGKHQMKSPLTAHQRAMKKQRDEQRRHHLHILKELEKNHPIKSVSENQAAAENTHLLYDSEASHLQSISALPADIEGKEHVLLTVLLSSPGVVRDRPQRKRKQVDPALTKAHIYNTLAAWFLSLVGPNIHAHPEVPFWVAGLQQLWTEDGLALHVLAVARHSDTAKENTSEVHTPFYNHICSFLSETSLARIAHWFPRLNTMQHYTSPIILPSSHLNSFISVTFKKKVIDRAFSLSPGFYWQTVETQENVCKGRETTQELHTEVSVALGCSDFFQNPLITHHTLQQILDSGLDVCGLRLLYPPAEFLSDSAVHASFIQRAAESSLPLFALAVRGPYAHSLLTDIARSADCLVPQRTSPTSVKPLTCRSPDLPVLYSPELVDQVHRELCLWFSGRLKAGSGKHHNQSLNRCSNDGVNDSLLCLKTAPSSLCATMKADLLLVVSPLVPPCCYGLVLAVCERRGFILRGLHRLELQTCRAAALGLNNQQVQVFCSSSSMTWGQKTSSHCLMLMLRKENALHHSFSLPAALMREFKVQNLLSCLHSTGHVESSCCFHTVPYNGNLFQIFAKCAWAVPDPSAVVLSRQKCPSNSETEQVVLLTLCGQDMSQGLNLLHRALTQKGGQKGFELLGLKWLPVLTQPQAQAVSPYEVGEPLSLRGLDVLTSSPALVCILRQEDAFTTLKNLLPNDYPGNLGVLMSPTPEVASRQISLFFFEDEIISCPQMQFTVCLFKPGVWNQTFTEILRRLQEKGFVIVGLRVVAFSRSDATSLLSAESDSSDLEDHVQYLCSGSSLAICLHGNDAVQRLRGVLDQLSSVLRICSDTYHSYKGVYGSGSYQTAVQDVRRLFPDGLCCTETSTMTQEQILSMCSDPLASVEREQSSSLDPVTQENLSAPMGPHGGSGIRSALWQTTCLLLPFKVPLLDLLELLLRSGCHLVAGRMTVLDKEQTTHITETLQSSGGKERTVPFLRVPYLIVALQGHRIVTFFNLILESIYKERPDLEKLGGMIIYPQKNKEAKQLIHYLFEVLPPGSCQVV